jgi:hypothetical protein
MPERFESRKAKVCSTTSSRQTCHIRAWNRQRPLATAQPITRAILVGAGLPPPLELVFEENVAEFQRYLERLDLECARIFFDTKHKLLGDGTTIQGNRTEDAVLEKLKARVPKAKGT